MAEALDLVLKKTVSQGRPQGFGPGHLWKVAIFYFCVFNLRDTEKGAGFRVVEG